MTEFREPPFRKECEDGAIEVVLCVSHGLPDHLELIAMPNLPKPGAAS